jgi:hypothetical protein
MKNKANPGTNPFFSFILTLMFFSNIFLLIGYLQLSSEVKHLEFVQVSMSSSKDDKSEPPQSPVPLFKTYRFKFGQKVQVVGSGSIFEACKGRITGVLNYYDTDAPIYQLDLYSCPNAPKTLHGIRSGEEFLLEVN